MTTIRFYQMIRDHDGNPVEAVCYVNGIPGNFVPGVIMNQEKRAPGTVVNFREFLAAMGQIPEDDGKNLEAVNDARRRIEKLASDFDASLRGMMDFGFDGALNEVECMRDILDRIREELGQKIVPNLKALQSME